MTWAAQLTEINAHGQMDVKISKVFLTAFSRSPAVERMELNFSPFFFICFLLDQCGNTLFVSTLLFPNFKFVVLSGNFLIWGILCTAKYLYENSWASGKTRRVSQGTYLILHKVNGIVHSLLSHKLKDVTTICSDFFLCLRITIHELHLRNASVSVRGMYYYDGK